jgi:SNF2 family DNA or RNA helicase
MFDWLRKRLRPSQLQPLTLNFTLDKTDSAKHAVQVYKQVNGVDEPIHDVRSLWRYGYQEEHETDNGLITYFLTDEDWQTLQSLKSMNPVITDNGLLLFDFAPPILSYVRTKSNLTESEASSELRISEQPLEPVVEIAYDPASGLDVQAGFRTKESTSIISQAELTTTADGNYVLLGNIFAPLPKKLSEAAQQLLNRTHQHISPDKVPEFFQRDLIFLKKEFTAVLTDLASQIRVIEEPFNPVVHVHKDERGWLDFYVGYEAGGYRISAGLVAHKTGKQYIQMDDLTWIKNDSKTITDTNAQIRSLGAALTENGYRLPVSQFSSLEEFIAAIGGHTELSAAYQSFLDQLTSFKGDDRFQLSSKAEAQLETQGFHLRPYQRAGIHWLDWLFNNHLHGILADDMGLGKTIQTISIIRRAYERSGNRQPSLIVAPKSVLTHWERELNRVYPEMRTYRFHGPGRRHSLLKAVEPVIFITTYTTLVNDVKRLVEVPFFYLVLDEATNIKNPSARRTKATKSLNAAHRLALSGTPVENRPAELWSLFDFLMRGYLGQAATFNRLFEERINAGDRQASEKLANRIRPFLLRRRKQDVAKDLPEKIEIDEWCELTEEQRKLYGGLQGELKQLRDALQQGKEVNYTTNILPVITKLKQICDHPALVTGRVEPIYHRSEKYDWIMARVDEIMAKREQVVIFSHFLGMLNLIERSLQQKGIRHIRIDGSTSDRQSLIDFFNAGKSHVALCSLMAAGHGINLTGANHVIHADRWWNPAVEDQATDRVHRIGQDKTVYVYRILVEGTLEERIDRLLTTKRGLADQIVGAASRGSWSWTREELIELLQPLD